MDVEMLQSAFQRLLTVKADPEETSSTEKLQEATSTEEPQQATTIEETQEATSTEETQEATSTEETQEATTEEPQEATTEEPQEATKETTATVAAPEKSNEDIRRPVATPTRLTATKREASEHPGEPCHKKAKRLYTRQDLVLCACLGVMCRRVLMCTYVFNTSKISVLSVAYPC